MRPLALTCVAALTFAACAKPPEAQVVQEVKAEPGLLYQLDVDTLRFRKPNLHGSDAFAKLVEAHLLTAGLARAGGKDAQGMITLRVELPSPGYFLRARIKPRADDFCHLMVDLVQAGDQMTERAPFSALQALEAVFLGITSFQVPRLRALEEAQFARLSAAAAEFAREGKDPPMLRVEYRRVPRPVQLMPQEEYWVPPTGPSTVAPQER